MPAFAGLVVAICALAYLACAEPELEQAPPYVLRLRRDTMPVRRRGQVVSQKTSYSGLIRAGEPAQEFRVVFDTGSGHVVLPAVECESEACLVHRRYNMTASTTASAINADGSPAEAGELSDQVTIGFGTGEVTGEFARERVCLGGLPAEAAPRAPCAEMHAVVAVEMSLQPFKSSHFDGIFGLGLGGLSLTPDFSLLRWLGGVLPAPQFAVFLTEHEEDGGSSEIAFGGHNPARLQEPLTWAPVAEPELGYWAVEIFAVRVGGVALDVCRDGGCRGVVDTGTSHLGVPTEHVAELEGLLAREAGGLRDCRLAAAPPLEIEVPGRNLTLHPESYMRRLPLRADTNIASVPVGGAAGAHASAREAARALARRRRLHAAAKAADPAQRHCRPRILPVSLPLGPKAFILGEPILQRYYTVFDWRHKQIGFSLASRRRGPEALRNQEPEAAEPARGGTRERTRPPLNEIVL